ncbi:MAG TPA: sensor histidine kinase [Chromatiales bacterium]|nr:sensor histidine kinase [Chromatiales bacterium]HEX22844.1 sensor histidine kinase [Chromatiales bacterium]
MSSQTQPITTSDNFFLPDFCSVRMVFAVVVISELLAIVLTLAPMESRSGRWDDLSITSLFIQWVGLSSAAVLCISRPRLSRMSETRAAVSSYLLLITTTLVITELAWWISQEMPHVGIDKQWNFDSRHADLLLRNLGISAIVSALVLRYFYVQQQWKKNMRAEAEARLQALQSRIRPHFLFNSLNTIASLTQINPKQAEEAVENLADLFRNSMADASHQITLREELALSHRYLDIEKLRLGDRLQLRWCIDELPSDALVPRLIIQPLLENAIYHGIETMGAGGIIGIDGHQYDREIYISISNPLPTQQDARQHQGNRIAVENIRQRLAAIYGEQGRLTTQADADSYITTITLPYTTLTDVEAKK